MTFDAKTVEFLSKEFINCVLAVRFVAGDACNLVPFPKGKVRRRHSRDHVYRVVFPLGGRVALTTGFIDHRLDGLKVLSLMTGGTFPVDLFGRFGHSRTWTEKQDNKANANKTIGAAKLFVTRACPGFFF